MKTLMTPELKAQTDIKDLVQEMQAIVRGQRSLAYAVQASGSNSKARDIATGRVQAFSEMIALLEELAR